MITISYTVLEAAPGRPGPGKKYGVGPDSRPVKVESPQTLPEARVHRREHRDQPLLVLEAFARDIEALSERQVVVLTPPTDKSATHLTTKERLGDKVGAIARTKSAFRPVAGAALLGLDFDRKGWPEHLQQVNIFTALLEACSAFNDACGMHRASISAGIRNKETGDETAPDAGEHWFFIVKDGADIERFVGILDKRLIALGYGYAFISKAGITDVRSIIDRMASVDTSRIWYEGKAELLDPRLEMVPGARNAQFINLGGKLLDTSQIEAVDTDSYEAMRSALLMDAETKAVPIRAAHMAERVKDMVAKGVNRAHAERTMASVYERHTLPSDFPIEFDDGTSTTAGEIAWNPAAYKGKTMPDPLEPDYGGGRNLAKVQADYQPVTIHSQAHGGIRYHLEISAARAFGSVPPPPPPAGAVRVPLTVLVGEEHALREAINDGLAVRDVPVFEWRERLALMTATGPRPLSDAEMRPLLASNFTFSKYVRTKDGGLDLVRCETPPAISQSLLTEFNAVSGSFRSLKGSIDTPYIRKDGSIANIVGYDPVTQLYGRARMAMPAVPETPTRGDALAALALINEELLGEIAFVSEQDRSVAVALLLSAVTRPSLAHQPGFFVSAPQYGSGKSYFAELFAELTTGSPARVFVCPARDDEMEKMLTGALIEGQNLIAADNINRVFRSVVVAQALTQKVLVIRELGTSNIHRCDTRLTTVIVNGNNISISEDLERRMLGIYLDPNVDNAFQRKFAQVTPVDRIRKDRGRYFSALMTIVRARIQSGYEHDERLNGFDEWNWMVRGALLWLGLPDPWRSLAQQSPEQEEHADRLTALLAFWPGRSWRPKDLHSPQPPLEGFREAFSEFYDLSGRLNVKSFGRWCARHVGRRISGMKLVRQDIIDENHRRVPAYQVVKL